MQPFLVDLENPTFFGESNVSSELIGEAWDFYLSLYLSKTLSRKEVLLRSLKHAFSLSSPSYVSYVFMSRLYEKTVVLFVWRDLSFRQISFLVTFNVTIKRLDNTSFNERHVYTIYIGGVPISSDWL